MNRFSRWAHGTTIALMAVMVLVATGDGFAQSYSGIYHWALEHGLHGWKAESFPLMIDLFIGVGELGLFALALEAHRLRKSALSWLDLAVPVGIAAGGWIVSLVFNVGAVKDDLWDQLTAAVPPIASMLGLLVLLRTLHRLVSRTPAPVEVAAEVVPAETPAPAAWVFWPPFVPVDGGQEQLPEVAPEPDVPAIEAAVPDPGAGAPEVPEVYPEIARRFVAELEQGKLPTYRVIKKRLQVGQEKAREVRAELAVLVSR